MYGDIRDDWKIRDVEQKVDRVERRLYELDSLRNDVGSLERANRDLSSICYELRSELENLSGTVRYLEGINQE